MHGLHQVRNAPPPLSFPLPGRGVTGRSFLLWPRYVLDIGQSQDWLGLQIALAPCLLGYGALAKMLHGDPRSVRQGNHYWNWVENYVADDYVQAVETGSGELAQPLPPISRP